MSHTFSGWLRGRQSLLLASADWEYLPRQALWHRLPPAEALAALAPILTAPSERDHLLSFLQAFVDEAQLRRADDTELLATLEDLLLVRQTLTLAAVSQPVYSGQRPAEAENSATSAPSAPVEALPLQGVGLHLIYVDGAWVERDAVVNFKDGETATVPGERSIWYPNSDANLLAVDFPFPENDQTAFWALNEEGLP